MLLRTSMHDDITESAFSITYIYIYTVFEVLDQ